MDKDGLITDELIEAIAEEERQRMKEEYPNMFPPEDVPEPEQTTEAKLVELLTKLIDERVEEAVKHHRPTDSYSYGHKTYTDDSAFLGAAALSVIGGI